MTQLAIGTLGFLPAFSSAASAAVEGREVVYQAGGATLKGYLASDLGRSGPRPGVLVVPEWWGLNDYARRRARMLADLGFTALAVDMYGEGRAVTLPDEAAALAGNIRRSLPVAKERFMAALALLKAQPTVDPQRIAAIGYCFGGGVALEMARAGVDFKGAVSFHGNLGTEHPAQPGRVRARILVLNGAADPLAPPEQVAAFKKEMAAAGADCKFIDYPGALHAFTNPDSDENGKRFKLPLAYNPEADRASWRAMQEFFAKIFH